MTLKLRTAFLFSSLYASCLLMSSTVLWRLSSNHGESLPAQFLHRLPLSSLRFPKSPILSPQISQFFCQIIPFLKPPSSRESVTVLFVYTLFPANSYENLLKSDYFTSNLSKNTLIVQSIDSSLSSASAASSRLSAVVKHNLPSSRRYNLIVSVLNKE